MDISLDLPICLYPTLRADGWPANNNLIHSDPIVQVEAPQKQIKHLTKTLSKREVVLRGGTTVLQLLVFDATGLHADVRPACSELPLQRERISASSRDSLCDGAKHAEGHLLAC